MKSAATIRFGKSEYLCGCASDWFSLQQSPQRQPSISPMMFSKVLSRSDTENRTLKHTVMGVRDGEDFASYEKTLPTPSSELVAIMG
jgi:hypothetical protein